VGDAAFFADPIHSSGVHLAFYSGIHAADAVHAQLKGNAQALTQYARRVQRHHRAVRYNVSLYYKVLTRYRAMAWFFIRLTGDWVGHWRGPWFRRINAWSFGHYGRYAISMWSLWILAYVGAFFCSLYYGVTGRSRWGVHGYHDRSPRPFSLPKSPPADDGQPALTPTDETDAHLEPQQYEPQLESA